MTQQATEERVSAVDTEGAVVPQTLASAPAPTPTPETATPTPELEIDWKARAEGLEKQVADFRANEIARLQASERDRLSQVTNETVRLIAEHLEEVTPGIKAKLEALQAKAKEEGVSQEFAARQNEVSQEVAALATNLGLEGFDPAVGLDADKHSEFRNAIAYWNQAVEKQSPYLLERTLSEAHVAARKIEKARASKSQQDGAKQMKETVDAAVKAALNRAGAKDLDSGRDAGGGGSESWRSLSPEEKVAYGLRQQAERASAR